MARLSALVKLGFQEFGEWTLDGTQIAYRLAPGADVPACLDTPKALYAFSRGDEVQYLGKTARTMRQRLTGYKHPGPGQRTNIRCNKKIKEALISSETIGIFVFIPISYLHYGDLVIDLAAGLEDALIKKFDPPWNGREMGQLLSEEAEREAEEEETVTRPTPT